MSKIYKNPKTAMTIPYWFQAENFDFYAEEKKLARRNRCRFCKYKAGRFSVEHCDYAYITGRSRCCSVEKCDKFERGNRKKVSKQITYSSKDRYKNGKNRI